MSDAAGYIDDPNYFDPPAKPESRPGGGPDHKKRPLWIPKHGTGVIRGWFLRPTQLSQRFSRRGHFNAGTKTTFWCESCTDVSRFGDFCNVVKGQATRAMAKDSALSLRDAQKDYAASERFYYPFYATKTFKDTKTGEWKEYEVGSAGLELNYTAAYTQLKAASDKLGKRCRSCGANGSVVRKGWACGTCSGEVVWDEEDQKRRLYPACPNCKERKVCREVVACSKCATGARLTIYDTQVTIQKLADGKTVDFDFEIPATPPPDKVVDCERFDLKVLAPYTPADQLVMAFGLQGDEPPPAEERSSTAAVINDDEIPF